MRKRDAERSEQMDRRATRNRSRVLPAALVAAAVALLLPEAAHAYGGPGSVISGIGALLAAIAAVGAALFGFFWFPMKRLYQKLRGDDEQEGEVEGEVAEAS